MIYHHRMSLSRDNGQLAELAADPAGAAIFASLLSERALRPNEIASETNLPLESVRGKLARMGELTLVSEISQGGRAYYKLTGSDTAQILERRFGLCARPPHARLRTGPADPELRRARSCYGHLAGEMGVWLYDRLIARGYLSNDGGVLVLTPSGAESLSDFGVNIEPVGHRPLCRTCLDWSVRRSHLAGELGKAVLQRLYRLGWAVPATGTRAVNFSASGSAALEKRFG